MIIMSANVLNCEDELINLCGRVQNFGYLVVLNENKTCVAVSQNCQDFFKEPALNLINKDLSFFESFLNCKIDLNLENFKFDKINDYQVSINQVKYQLSVYLQADKFLLELEKNNDQLNIDLFNFEQLKESLDLNDLWDLLSKEIYKNILFDRIMIYQFLDDGSGIVVAESINGKLPSVLGYRYPEFDIPKQARKLFTTNFDRQTPDIYADPIQIIGLKPSEIDLSKSKIRAMSPTHLQYLKNTDLVASASFSIIIDDKLWGLVCCQHQQAKYITINERKRCNYLIATAAKYFKNQLTIQKLNVELKFNEIESEIMYDVLNSKSTQFTLAKFSSKLLELLSASGIIICFADSLIAMGETPSEDQFFQIKNDLYSLNNKAGVFTTHEYSKIKNDFFLQTENFSGIARINFDKKGDTGIFLFRPEVVQDQIWAGIPEKHLGYSEECNALLYSPRTSFDAWKKQVLNESEKWKDSEIEFMNRLYTIIKESIIF